MSNIQITRSRHIVEAWMVMGCLSLAAPSAADDDIYKSTDAQGRPVYSDRPLSSDAEQVRIETRPRDAAAAQAQATQELAELARRQEERDRQLAADKTAKQVKEAPSLV